MKVKLTKVFAMIDFGRLCITFYWRFKYWHWGRDEAFCGCFVCDFGPIGIEYLPKGGECDLARSLEEEND